MVVAGQSVGRCELREELNVFLTNERCDDAKLLASDEWCARLAYMVDICQHLNELNILDAEMKTCSQIRVKLMASSPKVQLWQQHLESTNLGMFPLTQKWQGNNTGKVPTLACSHSHRNGKVTTQGKYQPWHVPTHTEMARCQHCCTV